MDKRRDQLTHWLTKELQFPLEKLQPLAGDASLRRYFRAHSPAHCGLPSRIIMDAPPQHESCKPFIALATIFADHGLTVPEILAQDTEHGFLLLSDFGDNLYLEALQTADPNPLYLTAIEALGKIQRIASNDYYQLPDFNAALLAKELALFEHWFLKTHLALELTALQQQLLQQAFAWMTEQVLRQPRVCVHRDYHSRNLMVLPEQKLGIIDFQDAVLGPITYDLVSLLKDCYISWTPEQVRAWVRCYCALASEQKITADFQHISLDQFMDWFELMGIQRHLKALGIFARLNAYYGKPGYLKDMPRTLAYITAAIVNYPALRPFQDFLAEVVQTRLANKEVVCLS